MLSGQFKIQLLPLEFRNERKFEYIDVILLPDDDNLIGPIEEPKRSESLVIGDIIRYNLSIFPDPYGDSCQDNSVFFESNNCPANAISFLSYFRNAECVMVCKMTLIVNPA
jgi:hypothetical protein